MAQSDTDPPAESFAGEIARTLHLAYAMDVYGPEIDSEERYAADAVLASEGLVQLRQLAAAAERLEKAEDAMPAVRLAPYEIWRPLLDEHRRASRAVAAAFRALGPCVRTWIEGDESAVE